MEEQMKYKTVKIPGHPRSGSHWINRVIDLNFFNGKDYLRHYGGHPWGNEQRANKYLRQPKQAVIYTHRNIDDAVNSIYRMRHRFGLNRDDYDQFCTTPMIRMYNPNLKVVAIRDTINKKDRITEVDHLFARRNETVPEYIRKHVHSWRVHFNKPNFIMLSYDSLVDDFQGTMLRVAHFLGSDKTEFVDEQKRVGWREKQDNAWEKPGNSSSKE